jgi:hypothetical protein
VFDQLHQDPSGGGGVEKRDSVAVGAGAGFPVDETDAGGFEPGELGFDVVGAVRDVVQAGAASFEEATHGRVGSERLEQLDVADEGDADALRFEGLGWGTRLPGQEFVDEGALLERVDGDRHVVERLFRRWNGHHGRPVSEDAMRVNGSTVAPGARERYKENRDGK